MLTLESWVACFLMISMLVCGYLCLFVKETTRDYEHGSIKLLYKLRYQSIDFFRRSIFSKLVIVYFIVNKMVLNKPIPKLNSSL